VSICVKCRGRKLLCGLPKCPIEPRARAFHLALRHISGREVFGSTPPSVIVGEFGWPSVSVYLGEPPEVFGEEARRYDDPGLLWGLSLDRPPSPPWVAPWAGHWFPASIRCHICHLRGSRGGRSSPHVASPGATPQATTHERNHHPP